MKEGQLSFGQYKFDSGWTITAKPVETFTQFSPQEVKYAMQKVEFISKDRAFRLLNYYANGRPNGNVCQ